MERKHRWFLAVQVASAAVSLWWLWRLPSSGYAVALIAFVAAVMSVHEKMHQWQKVVWITIIGILLVVELRAIRHDREEDAKTLGGILANQQNGFQNTTHGLETVIADTNSQFQQTAQALQQSLQATNKLLKQTSPYASFSMDGVTTNDNALILFNFDALLPNTPLKYNLSYRNIGTEPARSVEIFSNLYIGDINRTAPEDLRKRFESEWNSKERIKIPSLAVTVDDKWDSFQSDSFSKEDVDAVRVFGSKTVYVLSRFAYTDSRGRWWWDYCETFQQPLVVPPITHPCTNDVPYHPTRR